MASVKGPLFSLSASGAVAKTLVYGSWKGVKTVRQHVDPANPNTAAQQTQRTLMTDAVFAWKNYFTDSESQAAWDRGALNDSRPMSGFNLFTSNMVKMTSTDNDASFCNAVVETAANKVSFTMLNADAGDTGDEAGSFDIWIGSTISNLTLNESVAIAAGVVIGTSDLGDAADVLFAVLRKDGFDRSGIYQITLID